MRNTYIYPINGYSKDRKQTTYIFLPIDCTKINAVSDKPNLMNVKIVIAECIA